MSVLQHVGRLAGDADSRGGQGEACCLRGPENGQPLCAHWREFERLYTLAHLRGDLLQVAHGQAEKLRRDGIAVTRVNLQSAILFAIGNVQPRSALIPPGIDDATVERVLSVVIADFFREAVEQ